MPYILQGLSEGLSPTVGASGSLGTTHRPASHSEGTSSEETAQNITPIIPPHHRRPRGSPKRAPQIPANSPLVPPPHGVPTTFSHPITNLTRKSFWLRQDTFVDPFFKETMKGIYCYPPLDSLNSVLRIKVGGLTAQKAYRMSVCKHEVRVIRKFNHPLWSASYPSQWLLKMLEMELGDTLAFNYRGYHDMPDKDIWERIHVFDVEKVPGSVEDSEDEGTALAAIPAMNRGRPRAALRGNGAAPGNPRRSKKRGRNNTAKGDDAEEEEDVEGLWDDQGAPPMTLEFLTREQRLERRREKASEDGQWEESPETLTPSKRALRSVVDERPAKRQKGEKKKKETDAWSSYKPRQKNAPSPDPVAAAAAAGAAQMQAADAPRQFMTPSVPGTRPSTRRDSTKQTPSGGFIKKIAANPPRPAMLQRLEDAAAAAVAAPAEHEGRLETDLQKMRAPIGVVSMTNEPNQHQTTPKLTQEVLFKSASSLKKAQKIVQELISLPYTDTKNTNSANIYNSPLPLSKLSPAQLQQAQQASPMAPAETCHVDEDTLGRLRYVGASISTSMGNVLRGQLQFNLCVGQVPEGSSRLSNGREGSSASAIYALENIPAGVFVFSELNSVAGFVRGFKSPNLGLAEVVLPDSPAVGVFFTLRNITVGEELTQLM